MEFYEPAELERVIHRSAHLLDLEIDADGAAEIAGRSRGTPRIANRLLRRVRDYAQVKAEGWINRDIAAVALRVYEVDERGLDRLDRAVLQALLKLFGGGPVGLSTLAVAVGEERETVEEVAEPFLVREGSSPVHRAAGWRPPRHGRTSGSRHPWRGRAQADNRGCSGRERAVTRPGRNPAAMLGVVPLMRTRLDSADAARNGRLPTPVYEAARRRGRAKEVPSH